MARIKIKQKFPCGYELDLQVNTIRQVDLWNYEIGLCPLHGDECKLKPTKD